MPAGEEGDEPAEQHHPASRTESARQTRRNKASPRYHHVERGVLVREGAMGVLMIGKRARRMPVASHRCLWPLS